jgi:acyl-CoA oxidase
MQIQMPTAQQARIDVPNAVCQPKASGQPSSSFSTELERLLFSGLRAADSQEIRALLEDEMFRRQEGLTAEQAAALGYRRVRFLAAALKISAAELREDPRRLFALHDWTGLVDGVADTILSTHYCSTLGSLLVHGDGRPELAGFIAELERVESLGIFLATELGYGNDLAALETEAVYDAHRCEFTLSSPTRESSKFMPNAGLAVPTLAVVMARLISRNEDHGVFPFLVRLRGADGRPCPGIRIAPLSEKPGYALDNGIAVFDAVRIPKAQLLRGSGGVLHDDGSFESRIPSYGQRFLTVMDRVQTGRVCFAGSCAAVMRAATWIGVRYTAQRLASAPGWRSVPLLSCRNVQRDLFAGLATAYALTFAGRFLQSRFRGRSAETESEVFRLTTTLTALVTAEVSEALPRLREHFAAVGMLSANRILDYWRQIQSFVTAEGNNQLMLKVGRQLVDSPDSPLPVVRRPAGSAALDPKEAVFLFRYREAWLRQELKESVGEAQRRTHDALAIWNENVNRTLALANAYGTRLLAECFGTAIAECEDVASTSLLRVLFSLWALDRVERHAGWYLSQGCISCRAVEDISSDRDRLCAGIEPHVHELIDAFGIDNALLRAPSAEDDYLAAYDAFVAPPAPRHDSGAFPLASAEEPRAAGSSTET